MEWLIGIAIVWFIWYKLKGNGEEALKRAIGVAYAREGESLPTKIRWNEAEKFIVERGKEVNEWGDGGASASVPMLVNGEEVTVTLTRNSGDGTTLISADNPAKRKMAHKEYMKSLGVDI